MSEAEVVAQETSATPPPVVEETPKTEEVKKPEAAPPEPPKPSHLERAKAAAERERKAQVLRRQEQVERQRLAQERAELERQLAQERAAREQFVSEYRQLQALLEEQKKDPLAVLEKLGVPADVIAKRALEANTPDAKIAKLEQLVLEERDARTRLEKQREEERQAREEAQRRQEVSARAAAAHQAFIQAAANEEKYPHLAAHAAVRPRALLIEATAIVQDAYDRTGIAYEDEDVLEFLEQQYAHAAEKAATRPTKKDPVAESKESKTEKTSGSGNQEKKTAGEPRTLTNDATAVRGSLPANFDELSDPEQKALMADMLRRLTRG